MTEEIKEIQSTLNYYKTIQQEPVYCEELIITGELQNLLDYITNLQQENERLKGYKDFYKDLLNQSEDNIKQLIKKLNDYKSRCQKAIEILKLCNSKCAKETINILQGSDEE